MIADSYMKDLKFVSQDPDFHSKWLSWNPKDFSWIKVDTEEIYLSDLVTEDYVTELNVTVLARFENDVLLPFQTVSFKIQPCRNGVRDLEDSSNGGAPPAETIEW